MHLIILFALLQGFTEFIPVSSQGHLIIFNNFFNINIMSNITVLEANVIAHAGSLVAVSLYYRKEIFSLFISLRHIVRPDIDKNSTLLIQLIIATLPILLCGFFFSKYFNYSDKSLLLIIGITSISFGIVLFFFDRFCLTVKGSQEMNFLTSLCVGIFQCLALIPGVSRSGIAITAARFLKFKRVDSAKLSFLISIPILGAVTIFGLKNILITESQYEAKISIFAICLAFLFSLITIKFFLKYLNRFSLNIFVYYRVLLGIILLFLTYS